VDNFGDDEGNEVVYSGTVVQALLMMNGDEINKTISEKNGIVDRMLARRGNATENITYLFMITLNRQPSKAELARFRTAMELTRPRLDTKEGRWHDLLWALVNCNEFILNH
jgi:hypothetical protein